MKTTLYTVLCVIESTVESFAFSWISDETQSLKERVTLFMEKTYDRETYNEMLMGEGTLDDAIQAVCDIVLTCDEGKYHDLIVTVEKRDIEILQ